MVSPLLHGNPKHPSTDQLPIIFAPPFWISRKATFLSNVENLVLDTIHFLNPEEGVFFFLFLKRSFSLEASHMSLAI